MLGKLLTITLTFVVLLLAVLWQLTTPTQVGPLGILIVFVLMYLATLSMLTLSLFSGGKLVNWLFALLLRKSSRIFTISRSYYYSSVIALAPVMFIGMISVGEATIYDVILIALFVGIGCIYIAKRTT